MNKDVHENLKQVAAQLRFYQPTDPALLQAVYYQLTQINQAQHTLLEQALPALQRDEASQKALVATVSALRGYLILGKDPAQASRLKQEWESAWQAIAHQTFSPALTKSLETFKSHQEKVWTIAQSEENLPAHTLMLQEAVPLWRRRRSISCNPLPMRR